MDRTADGLRRGPGEGHPQPHAGQDQAVAAATSADRRDGLIRRARRQFVPLTADAESAAVVGGRRGRAVVLKVDAARLHADGGSFFRSAGGVWLTREVPPQYITVA
ncbi:MAG: RNA 2'-phosphotransferase [Planctomycetes bacterium]|nr:RNA 2'-phosphotransferase [Planctomycetota bacterium]